MGLWRGTTQAQDTTRVPARPPAQTRADSARQDSLRARFLADSIAREARRLREERQRADSVKTPLARAETPVSTAVDSRYRWDRESLFASGALSLGELLDQVPGATTYRSGWLGSPEAVAYMGAFKRVRVFYEGIELDALDPRTRGVLDLSYLDTWHMEDVRVENAADEMRIHLNTWRVRSTTPATRVDFSTGDLKTNAYRGYYGRRLNGGQLLQFGAQQFSTTDERNRGDAQQLSLWARLGWAKKKWSVDASLFNHSRDREVTLRLADLPELPKFDGTSTTAYARVAYGDPAAGVWFQGLASRQHLTLHVPPYVVAIDSITDPTAPDTTFRSDSAASAPQYALTGGWSSGPIRLSAVARLRDVGGTQKLSPGIRASYETGPLTVSLYGERSPADSVTSVDASARVMVLPWLALMGAVGRRMGIEGGTAPTTLAARGEVGLRLGGVWATAGVMSRDTSLLPPPAVFDSSLKVGGQGATSGLVATLRGRVWKDIGIDAWGVQYNDAGFFRPQYQARTQVYFNSGLLGRFPSGNLNILAAITHEYRSQALFPVSPTEILRSSQYRTWNFLLEVRLLSATLSYQYRNFFLSDYSQVPGFRMPRPVNFYGIRWNFYN